MAKASSLADTIRAYWRAHGYPAIRVWHDENDVLRSNIGPRGYPPRDVT